MIHSHVYISNPTYTTSECIPCGAIEEFDSIIKAVPQSDTVNFGINLKGHGSLIIVDKVSEFNKFKFVARPIPEFQEM